MSMIKEKSLLKMKNLLVPKKESKFKSKTKQVIPQECGKSSYKKKRTCVEDLYANDEVKLSVMERVEEVFNSIADDYPSFVKCMLPSNVSHGFWLHLPQKFCREYLPMNDSTITLIDECGKEYEANYLVDRYGLSGGWRAFSFDQRILKGDHLVFQLIRPCTLKVHIVRVYGLDEVDAALCLMSFASIKRKATFGKKKGARKSGKPLVNTNDGGYLGEVMEGSDISEEFSEELLVSSHPRNLYGSFEAHNIPTFRTSLVSK